MKTLKYILSATIWTIIGLYILMIVAFHIPPIQRYMGQKTADLLGETLGTEVTVGSINPGFLNRLIIDHVSIQDQQGEEMLRVRRMGIRISLWDLLNGKISISSAQLFGAHANLYQTTPEAAPNYQFALDSLASKDTTSQTPLDLHINSLIMRHSSVRFNRRYEPETPQQLNPSHLYVKDISAYIILKTLTPDTMNINVKKLAFTEQSGLKMDKLSMHFEGGRTHSHLYDLRIQMPGTDFSLHEVTADYLLTDDQLQMGSLTYQGEIPESHIRLSDISCLLPSLKTFNSTLTVASHFKGKGYDIEIPDINVSSSTGDIDIHCNGFIKHLDHQPEWYANLKDLSLSSKTLSFISENLRGQKVEVPDVIDRMGDIHLSGDLSGRALEQVNISQQIRSGAGNATVHFALDPQQQFTGDVETTGINLRQLLDDEHFGTLATNIQLSGSLAKGQTHLHADGIINELEYNNYSYRHITLNGSYAPGEINGKCSIDDPRIRFDLETTIQGTGLNDAKGFVDISHFAYHEPEKHYEMDHLTVNTGFDQQTHYLLLNSDFAQAEIRGDFDYQTLTQSVTNFLASQMPTLPGLPKVNPDTHNNFTVHATIRKSDWLQQLIGIPLAIQQPVILEGFVNDHVRSINLECSLPSFDYADSGYRNGHIVITTPGDSLACNLSITKLMDNGNHFDLNMKGRAHNNHLVSSFSWDNHAKEQMSGTLNSTANFFSTPDGRQVAYIGIAPSHINIHNTIWNTEPCAISYSDKRLEINDLNVHHGDQYLKVNGTASAHSNDSLVVDLHEIDVAYILELVNFDAVSFSGLATGQAHAKGVFGKQLEGDANLTVNEFKFEHGRMGTLGAHVNWNREKEQIDILATADDGEDAMTYINGYVSPTHNYIDLGIKAVGTHIDFMHSFTRSFLSKVDGHANGDVRLYGPLDHINLTGELVVNGLTHVKPIGCSYELRNDTIRMTPNEITFVNCPIYDIHDQQGIVTGGIHHDYLTKLTYDLNIRAQNLLAYDFPDFGDDTFYGTVYGTGDVEIHGRSGEVVINLNVTPEANSVFVYNAADPDAVSNQEFIHWGIKDHTQTTADNKKTTVIVPVEERSDMRINFLINCTPNAALRLLMDSRTNDYITLRGDGVLRATWFNKGGFNMFGTYRVANGTYDVTIQNVIKKNFTFQEGGTIVFGGDPYSASLNLQAVHTVNGVSLSDLNVGRSFSNTVRVNCLMNITGQPSQPVVEFDLDMPNVNTDEKQMVRSLLNSQDEMNQQVVYLLAIGRFYPQGANNAENPNEQSQTSLAMQSLLSGTLSGQINSLLKSVIKSNDWSFGANISTGDEGWNNAEYEGLISGRLFNNRLLINGQFGYRDNTTTANPSFIGDFDIRYLLLPSGNLALKVYNQTNDRYFTKSSLNTQGIGLIMKKDFNGFRDLFSTKRKKKKSSQP
ncbi:MAG: translocation/assembly module TamB domain-containing protein [Prevotella sp.]|nr:translocation/assembly module TamB domain-containing protein [Prevotella sp.]